MIPPDTGPHREPEQGVLPGQSCSPALGDSSFCSCLLCTAPGACSFPRPAPAGHMASPELLLQEAFPVCSSSIIWSRWTWGVPPGTEGQGSLTKAHPLSLTRPPGRHTSELAQAEICTPSKSRHPPGPPRGVPTIVLSSALRQHCLTSREHSHQPGVEGGRGDTARGRGNLLSLVLWENPTSYGLPGKWVHCPPSPMCPPPWREGQPSHPRPPRKGSDQSWHPGFPAPEARSPTGAHRPPPTHTEAAHKHLGAAQPRLSGGPLGGGGQGGEKWEYLIEVSKVHVAGIGDDFVGGRARKLSRVRSEQW